MNAAELHAEVLDALTDACNAVADSAAAPWYVGATPGPYTRTSIIAAGGRRGVAYDVPFHEAHLVVAIRNTASASLRGARRIIERHAPTPAGRCGLCWDRRRADGVWPCEDYQDAAAGLPGLPKEVADALRR